MNKEYIEREAAKKLLWLELDGITHAVIACRLINDVPAADVVEVVRCKDCLYCFHDADIESYKCTTFNGMKRDVDPNEFCSYAERPLEENNG